jgi:hypothetical protein
MKIKTSVFATSNSVEKIIPITPEPEPVPEQGAGCLNAGQTEEEDECIEDTPENRAELVRQATEERTQPLTEEPIVPQFGMEDLDPDQPGLQQDDGEIIEEDQIAEDSNDIGGTETGSSEDTDTDTSDEDDVGSSGSSDGDDNGGDDEGGGGVDGGNGGDEGGA